MPMRKNSTLIYVVNRLKSEKASDISTQIDNLINNFLDGEPGAGSSPSEKTIDNILAFSRSYEVRKTENAGFVEINLN